ncbi:MAG: hypothetical protein JEZ06_19600 [Anaerolineaceae bacterium]|nr:hypothetical protein [Anaerolineaceae bacterium]
MKKLSAIQQYFDPIQLAAKAAIPIMQLDNQWIFTDGHTRAYYAHTLGINKIKVFIDPDRAELDMEMYRICVTWCKDEGIACIADLSNCLLSETDYQRLWLNRCKEMQHNVLISRKR